MDELCADAAITLGELSLIIFGLNRLLLGILLTILDLVETNVLWCLATNDLDFKWGDLANISGVDGLWLLEYNMFESLFDLVGDDGFDADLFQVRMIFSKPGPALVTFVFKYSIV